MLISLGYSLTIMWVTRGTTIVSTANNNGGGKERFNSETKVGNQAHVLTIIIKIAALKGGMQVAAS